MLGVGLLPLPSKAKKGLELRPAEAVYCSILPNHRSPTKHPFRKRLMAKSKKKVEVVFLVCEETGDYNYTIKRKQGGEKLKIKKFSPRLRKHTVHAEKKK